MRPRFSRNDKYRNNFSTRRIYTRLYYKKFVLLLFLAIFFLNIKITKVCFILNVRALPRTINLILLILYILFLKRRVVVAIIYVFHLFDQLFFNSSFLQRSLIYNNINFFWPNVINQI